MAADLPAPMMPSTHTTIVISAMSPDQSLALDAIATHRLVAVFGSAGSGKSWVRDRIPGRTLVLGPTGMSIVGVGMTLERFHRCEAPPPCEVVVVEEISMVSNLEISRLDARLRSLSGQPHETFGGKRVVFVGDVFQLRPADGHGPFFTSASWTGVHVVQLTGQHRQDSCDDDFGALLADARRGVIGHRANQVLEWISSRGPPPSDVPRIYSRRAAAERHNRRMQARLTGASHRFFGLPVKVGTRVCFNRNFYRSETLCANGQCGKVVGVESSRAALVRCDDDRLVRVDADVLGYGWALTIHRVQGQTLSRVCVDGGDFHEGGQAYVGISRVRRLDDLWVSHVHAEDFEIGRDDDWTRFSREHGLE